MINPLASAARQAYWRLARFAKADSKSAYPADFSRTEIETIEAVAGKTLTTQHRIVALIRAIEYLIHHRIAGDVVECGVWKGGSMMAAALTLKRLDAIDRALYLYDTYDGMPPPSDVDRDYLGSGAASLLATQSKTTDVWARAQLDEVQNNMRSTAYPYERLHFIKGKVEETIPTHVPKSIALLRLDTDWYESTSHELVHLFPRLVAGGVLILDDYGHWEGAKRAVDEYFEAHRLPILLCRIDMAGRIAIKQG